MGNGLGNTLHRSGYARLEASDSRLQIAALTCIGLGISRIGLMPRGCARVKAGQAASLPVCPLSNGKPSAKTSGIKILIVMKDTMHAELLEWLVLVMRSLSIHCFPPYESYQLGRRFFIPVVL